MSQTERIAYLDRRLRERGWITAAEAASQFEVSPRQIKRDIEYLRWRLDAPIVYEPRSRRYRYEKPYTRFQFADERRVLFSALVKGWAASEAFRPLVTPEILEAVEAAVARDYRSVAQKIRYEAPSVESVDLEVFAGLSRGIRDRRIVDLEYVDSQGTASRRRIEAERLINYGGVWYLVAWDHWRQGLRTFHLGRVRSLSLTSETVTHEGTAWAAEVESWMATGFGIFRGGSSYPATVRFRGAGLRLAQNQRWHPDQTDHRDTDDQGDYLDRTLPIVHDRELIGRILALGADAEARTPQEFRSHWETEVHRLAALLGPLPPEEPSTVQ